MEYTTNDTPPFKFTNTDFIIVHDSDSTIETIKLEDINHENTFVVKTGVSYKDLVEEKILREEYDNSLTLSCNTLSNSINDLSTDLEEEKTTRKTNDDNLSTSIKDEQ